MSLFLLKVWLTVNICAGKQRTVTGDKVDSDVNRIPGH